MRNRTTTIAITLLALAASYGVKASDRTSTVAEDLGSIQAPTPIVELKAHGCFMYSALPFDPNALEALGFQYESSAPGLLIDRLDDKHRSQESSSATCLQHSKLTMSNASNQITRTGGIMENNEQTKKLSKDYAPALEKSTKTQYSIILTMCLALVLMLMGLAGLAAYANWGAIQRFIG